MTNITCRPLVLLIIFCLPHFAIAQPSLSQLATAKFRSELQSVPPGQCVAPQYTETPRASEMVGTVELQFNFNTEGTITSVYPVRADNYMLEELTLRQLGGCKVPAPTFAGVPYAGKVVIAVPWRIEGVSDPVVHISENCRPSFTPEAIQRQARGTTVLNVEVSEDGQVTDTYLVTPSGHIDLDRAALMSIKTCRATPGLSAGKPKKKIARLVMQWLN